MCGCRGVITHIYFFFTSLNYENRPPADPILPATGKPNYPSPPPPSWEYFLDSRTISFIKCGNLFAKLEGQFLIYENVQHY